MVINGDLYGILWDLMMIFSVMGFSGIYNGNLSIKNAQSKSNFYHGVDIYIIHGWFQPSYFYHITIIKIMVFFFNEQFKNHVFVGINVNSTKTQRYPGEDNNIKKKWFSPNVFGARLPQEEKNNPKISRNYGNLKPCKQQCLGWQRNGRSTAQVIKVGIGSSDGTTTRTSDKYR